MDMYTSNNDYLEFGLDGVFPWGWQIKSSAYNQSTDETEVEVELGYENDTQFDYLFFEGDVDAVGSVMSEPAYVSSTGPIRGAGFPIK